MWWIEWGMLQEVQTVTCFCNFWMEVPFAEMVKSREGTVLGGWEDIH